MTLPNGLHRVFHPTITEYILSTLNTITNVKCVIVHKSSQQLSDYSNHRKHVIWQQYLITIKLVIKNPYICTYE